ncbi:MAG: hypothetical protein ACFFC3_09565, partial [Candidatus Odinarchaeota archaeon]
DNYYNTARYFYNRGIYSCPVWWSNPLNGTWSPNLIYKGVEILMRAALNAQMALVHAAWFVRSLEAWNITLNQLILKEK